RKIVIDAPWRPFNPVHAFSEVGESIYSGILLATGSETTGDSHGPSEHLQSRRGPRAPSRFCCQDRGLLLPRYALQSNIECASKRFDLESLRNSHWLVPRI